MTREAAVGVEERRQGRGLRKHLVSLTICVPKFAFEHRKDESYSRDVGLRQGFISTGEKEHFYVETAKRGAWKLRIVMCMSEGGKRRKQQCDLSQSWQSRKV